MTSSLRQNARTLIRWGWIYLLYCTGLLYWARKRARASQSIAVLTFHRVLEREQFGKARSPNGMIVSSQIFNKLLHYLKQDYEVIRLDDAFHADTPSAKPLVLVTFDDGWRDTATIALPLAERYQIPITLFICPGVMGKRSPFWPEKLIAVWQAASGDPRRKSILANLSQAAGFGDHSPQRDGRPRDEGTLLSKLTRLSQADLDGFLHKIETLYIEWGCDIAADPLEETLTWNEVLQLREKGVTIGSHTQHHAILTQLQQPELAAELAESKRDIERTLKEVCDILAYPNGCWSTLTCEEARRQGYTKAFANNPGLWTRDADPWCIPRINIWQGSITDPAGRFSPIAFQYAAFWRSRLKSRKDRPA